MGVTWFPRVSLSCNIVARGGGGGKEDSTPECYVMHCYAGRNGFVDVRAELRGNENHRARYFARDR